MVFMKNERGEENDGRAASNCHSSQLPLHFLIQRWWAIDERSMSWSYTYLTQWKIFHIGALQESTIEPELQPHSIYSNFGPAVLTCQSLHCNVKGYYHIFVERHLSSTFNWQPRPMTTMIPVSMVLHTFERVDWHTCYLDRIFDALPLTWANKQIS